MGTEGEDKLGRLSRAVVIVGVAFGIAMEVAAYLGLPAFDCRGAPCALAPHTASTAPAAQHPRQTPVRGRGALPSNASTAS